MEIIGLSHLTFPSDWSLASHAHDRHHETIVILGGSISVATRGQVVHGAAGSVLLYPRGVTHQERSASSSALSMLCLGWASEEGETGYRLDECACVVNDSRARISMLMYWLLDLSRRPAAAQARSVSDILKLIADEYYDLTTGSHEPHELVEAIRAYVQPRLSRRIELEDLSRAACLSRYRFAHAFTAAAGVPPMRFVRRMRAEAARTLLVNTNMPQSAVAEAVGLRDAVHLSRLIRQSFHCTPGRFRPGHR